MAGEVPAQAAGENGTADSNKAGEDELAAVKDRRGEDESDEEGEIKEAGSEAKEGAGTMRDLREEIEAKRGRRRPQAAAEGDRRTEGGEREREHPAEGYYNNVGRRGYDDEHLGMNGQGSNGHHDVGIRREDLRREQHPRGYEQEFEYRRGSMGGYDEGMVRRRPPSPYRPREHMMMRRASPPLRRMPSPPHMRRFPPDRFNPDYRDPREYEARGMMMDPRDRDFMRENSPRYAPRDRDMGGFPPDRGAVGRTCTLRISNLPHPQDVSGERLRADLLEEASMHGRIVEFQLHERDAFVTYVEPTMAENARRQMHRTVMHNSMLEVELDLSAPLPRSDGPPMGKEAPAIRRKPELFDEMDDPMATCRICVDEVAEGVSEGEVASLFKSFGFIDSLVFRRNRGQISAEMKFRSLSSAVRAKREMDGRRLWQNRSRVDYCMGPASCELWLGSVHGSVTEQQLGGEMGRFGKVADVRIHRNSKCAYVAYERTEDAQAAAEAMRGRTIGNSSWRLKVDFWERPEGPGRQAERRMSTEGRGERGGERSERVSSGGERREREERPDNAVVVQMRTAVSDKALATHLMAYGQVLAMDRSSDGLTATVRFTRPEEAGKAARDDGAAAVRDELGIESIDLARDAPKRNREDGGEWDGSRKRLHVDVPGRDRGGMTPTSFTPTPTGRGGWSMGYSEPLTTQGRVASGGSTPLSTSGFPPLATERKVASGGSTPTAAQSQPVETPTGSVPQVPRPPRRSDSTLSMEVEPEGRGGGSQAPSQGGAEAASGGVVEDHTKVEGEGGSAVPRNGERVEEASDVSAAETGGDQTLDKYPVVWPGAVAIKGAAVGIRLHGLGGAGSGLVSLLPPDKVTVTRRMKLEAAQMKEFTTTLNNWRKENFAMLLATPREESASKAQFDSQLVKYLIERNAAGVVQLEGSGMMYMFPPGDLAAQYLQSSVPELDPSKLDTYLLVVLAKGA